MIDSNKKLIAKIHIQGSGSKTLAGHISLSGKLKHQLMYRRDLGQITTNAKREYLEVYCDGKAPSKQEIEHSIKNWRPKRGRAKTSVDYLL